MDFEDPLPEDQYTSDDPQTQSTQQASQHQEDLERHLWGALIPCNSQIARVDLWKIQAVYEVGRNPTSNQVVFPGPKISNFHCRLVWDRKDTRDSVVTVSDFSSNGTFINGVKVGKGSTRVLREGNEIAFGSPTPQTDDKQDYRFIFRLMSGGDPEDGIHAHYDLTHELGKGSFATVMKAIERRTGEWFAVKIITDKHNRPGDQNRVAFTREIEIMKKLKHPNICELKEVFYQANALSICQKTLNFGADLVLELIEGGDLLQYILDRNGLDEDISKHITYQICDALAYIHSQGVAHRDLKPENVLLTKDDPPLVKVADFGLAKLVHGETMLRTMCGTPTYLAPEVVNQREGGGYTNRVDSWSVGVMLFSMLTNSSPFLEDDDQRDIRLRISQRKVDWTLLAQTGVSSRAYNFIESLLQENEGKRMSLTDSLKHPWLRSYTPTYNLRAYDTVSSLDPHDFSMLSSMPGFDMNASVTTNLNGLQITTNGHMPGAVVVAEGDQFI
ncbi:hypothetical protein AGABI1DRAFT_37595 [Agaricus bisporus var. burnettii JB137-S8]|uniref:Uncharacterized protein n=1 Tax=Agaricus bisporus var. burnettii (strain JB137-S8 / ATCC MYA-4627 / FGSC 10392) TaxID=597362 RepID=K5WZG7_AGABU|nr:uncharacterized protein AGABI1DRAFT_37595 [Agaricus bisporus var. burnettii JB137-S8]EKM80931.1 hypothetical protein AGABI1DRAFT_37595 [Agaricus bisporus var. burnettii JB137-S8]